MRVGIEWFENGPVRYALAGPEKALLDCIYVSTRRGNQFRHFPELDHTRFRMRDLQRLLRNHDYPPSVARAVHDRITELTKIIVT